MSSGMGQQQLYPIVYKTMHWYIFPNAVHCYLLNTVIYMGGAWQGRYPVLSSWIHVVYSMVLILLFHVVWYAVHKEN
jgi:hypothetical protein